MRQVGAVAVDDAVVDCGGEQGQVGVGGRLVGADVVELHGGSAEDAEEVVVGHGTVDESRGAALQGYDSGCCIGELAAEGFDCRVG